MVSRVKRWERRREGIREGRLGRIEEGSRNGEGRWVIRSAIVTRSLKRRIVELVIEFSSISNWTSLFPFFLIYFFFLLISFMHGSKRFMILERREIPLPS